MRVTATAHRHLLLLHGYVSLFNEGVDKVRLTGGEPTLRPDLVDIIRDLRNIDGIKQVCWAERAPVSVATETDSVISLNFRVLRACRSGSRRTR